MSKIEDNLDEISELVQHSKHFDKTEITFREEDWLKHKPRLDKIESKNSSTGIPSDRKSEILFINRTPYLIL
ncbi:hypothetical protein CK503_08750 [Aliifodinibius salipaludis]|uniref:Uncharacterized protein n=1 Tax=Fodinibius salipaludis TaxID=2032627 RepID=A0A2A2GAT8_9BACT|nr:hypothetical protein CK503_08750 [Aliifodinibius salipaludis]